MSKIPWGAIKTGGGTAVAEDRSNPMTKDFSKQRFQENNDGDSEKRSPRQNSFQIRVLNVPLTSTKDDVSDLFSAVGTVISVRLLPPKDGYDSCASFVTLSSEQEVADAIEKFDRYHLEGCTLRVFQAGQQNTNRTRNGDAGSREKNFGRSQPRQNGTRGDKACFGCGETGHQRRECPNKTDGEQHSRMNGERQNRAGRDEGFGRFRSNNQMGNNNHMGNDIDLESEPNPLHEQNQGRRRAPVNYIPPPPPEEKESIFGDSCHQGINFNKYEDIPAKITGRDPPRPMEEFSSSTLHSICIENIKNAKYEKPTPIQKYAIPIVLNNRDLMACAQTGSGKTAAFLLPLVTHILNNGLENNCEGVARPCIVVLVPTRELAIQIFKEARKFSYGTQLQCAILYGGVSVHYQLEMLERGCHLLVATPGRMADFILRGKVSLENTNHLVLDEADRMIDMGFQPQLQQIMDTGGLLPRGQRQTLMFSATFPNNVQEMAAEYLSDYLFVAIGIVGGTCTDITQVVVEMQATDKRDRLEEILLDSGSDRTLVFVETKRSADFLASFLSQRDFPATSLNGDRTQEEREIALQDFKSGRAPVLVATAVAARGLDIPDVKHVINYDLPSQIDEYVHRIGRTGRIGNKGKATSFFDARRDEAIARSLVKILSEASQVVPTWLEDLALTAVGTDYGPEGGQFTSKDVRMSTGLGRGLSNRSYKHSPGNFVKNDTRVRQQKQEPPKTVPATNGRRSQKNDDDEEGWD